MILQYLQLAILAILAGLLSGIVCLILLFLTAEEKDNRHPAMTEEQVKEIIKNSKK